MSINTNTPIYTVVSDGNKTSFTLDFSIDSKEDLKVTVNGITVSKNDYTFNSNTNSVQFYQPVTQGSEITIQRDTSLERSNTYATFGNDFRPESLNYDFNRIWKALQERGVQNAEALSALLNSLDVYAERDRSILDALKDETLKDINEDTGVAELIQLEAERRKKDDVAYDLLSQLQQGATLPELKEYIDNLLGIKNPILLSGITSRLIVDHESGETVKQTFEKQATFNDKAVTTVQYLNELLTITNPVPQQTVFVTEKEKYFIYKPDLNLSENGVTVFKKWEMQVQEEYLASWFCTTINDPSSPQQDNINTGYRYATSKGKPFVIDKPYYVKSIRKGGGEAYPALNSYKNGSLTYAVRVLSNSVLKFIGEGELKHVPTSDDWYAILMVFDVENYQILDPKLTGDKKTHLTTTGEQGHCLHFGASKNGYVRNPICRDAWGDGIYFGFAFWVKPNIDVYVPTDLVIDSPKIYNSSRNAVSLCGAENLTINDLYVDTVDRVAPISGIDIEPEEDPNFTIPMFVKNVNINNSTFINCSNYSVMLWLTKSRTVEVSFNGLTKCIGKTGGYTSNALYIYSNYSGESETSYSANGYVNFDHVQINDTGAVWETINLIAYKSPLSKIKTNVNLMEVISSTKDPVIAFGAPNDDTNFSSQGGLTINEFKFHKNVDSIVLQSENNNKINNLQNIKINLPKEVYVSYENKGFRFNDNTYIGGHNNIWDTYIKENEHINNLFIDPKADPTNAGAIYGRVILNSNNRQLSYSLNPILTEAQIGYGLQISGTNFFKGTATAAGSITIQHIKNPYNGIQVLSSYGTWTNP